MITRIWAREYSNGVHFSTVKKDGFTAFVPESLALALFLRDQLELVEQLPDEEEPAQPLAMFARRSKKTSRAPARAEQNTKKGKRK